MTSMLEINFVNNTSAEWQPDQNSDATLQVAGNSVISWPGAPLLPEGGSAACKITENMEKISVGPANFYYCWNDGTWRFGIKIIVKTQALGIGAAPQWEIMYDQKLQSPSMNWVPNAPNTATQFAFPTYLGYSIIATPTGSHQGLTVQVEMKNLPTAT